MSFSGDGQLLASGSEDLSIDIVRAVMHWGGAGRDMCPTIPSLLPQGYVENGDKVTDVPVSAATFAVAWHPKERLLAYACDDKVGCHAAVTRPPCAPDGFFIPVCPTHALRIDTIGTVGPCGCSDCRVD